jgi:ligand-binding sensor domain-containing protein
LPEVAGFQYTIGQIIVTRNNDKWIIVPRGRDVYVVNKDVTRKKYLPVTSYFNNGQQEIVNRMNDVYSIAEDLNGDIWIGTSMGIAVFATPHRVWQEGTYYAYQPSLELGDGIYHPLLETETISAIAVDGANRKWLGTKSSGLYLVSARGDKEISHFTTDNSPLLSNNITSLALHPKTGELFIGTDLGLISYQGDAPEGELSFEQVYVYPNPVRETYHGPVTIKGLMKDADIRITDVAGNLVHKTKSLGSQVVWDGKNLNGRRVSTGVYFIFAADAIGEQTHIAKLLFIR